MVHRFTPVVVWDETRKRRSIGDVEVAAEWLVYRWPEQYVAAPMSQAARMACLKAFERKGTANEARAAFVEAAEEAGILAEV